MSETTRQDVHLETRELNFAYRKDQPVLSDINFSAAAGELLCVLGPNGSGKSTLLRCLLGRLDASRGDVLLSGRPLSKYSPKNRARLQAYVPQFPIMQTFSVRETVLMGRFAHSGVLGLQSQPDGDIADEAMRMTEVLELSERMLGELSGGEAQRVMIARALAQQPSVLLLDEPTSHLDIRAQVQIYRMMQRLAHDWNMAVVCVSHDVNLAGRFADKLLLMRAGRIVAMGSPREVIEQELLEQTYDVSVELLALPDQSVPMVRVR